jgi:hypothetical protein
MRCVICVRQHHPAAIRCPETREQMLTATVDFLEKNNPPN